MLQAITVRLQGERIEIASGEYLGHEIGRFTVEPGPTRTYFVVNGHRLHSLTAALSRAMCEAWAYVSQQQDDDAVDA